MAFTDKKRRFVQAIQSGASGKQAAISAGYSEKGAPQAASRLMKDPDVQAALARKEAVNKAKGEAKEAGKALNLSDLSRMYSDPADFLRAVMNDVSEDVKIRADAAKALMPYTHGKMGEGGKKQQKAEAAQGAGSGRFGSRPAPGSPRVN